MKNLMKLVDVLTGIEGVSEDMIAELKAGIEAQQAEIKDLNDVIIDMIHEQEQSDFLIDDLSERLIGGSDEESDEDVELHEDDLNSIIVDMINDGEELDFLVDDLSERLIEAEAMVAELKAGNEAISAQLSEYANMYESLKQEFDELELDNLSLSDLLEEARKGASLMEKSYEDMREGFFTHITMLEDEIDTIKASVGKEVAENLDALVSNIESAIGKYSEMASDKADEILGDMAEKKEDIEEDIEDIVDHGRSFIGKILDAISSMFRI